MLIIVVTISTFVVLFTTIMRRHSFPLVLSAMNVANLLHVSCIVLYIAIMGGLASRDVRLLFLNERIMRWMHQLPVNLYHLGYLTSVSRLMVPCFLVMTALALSMNRYIRDQRRKIYLFAVAPTLLLALLYYPDIYKWMIYRQIHMLSLLVRCSFAWIVAELLVSLGILLYEYYEISIPVFRKNFLYILIAIVSQMLVYLIFATKDPAQIYNLFITEYLNLGISNYISPSLSSTGWDILILLVIAGALIGAWGIVRYEHFQYSEEREYAVLEKQFSAADMGISVFAHSMKNQILSAQVLHKRMRRELRKDKPDLRQLKDYEEEMARLNDSMKAHIDEYYATINSKHLILALTNAREVADAAISKFYEKYPGVSIRRDFQTGNRVLVDFSLFSEAIYNLLVNACEATAGIEGPARISLTIRAERMWVVFAVTDNGIGVPDKMRRKIFQPFLTSKSKDSSWGMGLFYTNRIVRQHMGHLRMESKSGEGSTFMILLPALTAGRKPEMRAAGKKEGN